MKTAKQKRPVKKEIARKHVGSVKTPVSPANKKQKETYKGINNWDEGSLE